MDTLLHNKSLKNNEESFYNFQNPFNYIVQPIIDPYNPPIVEDFENTKLPPGMYGEDRSYSGEDS